MVLKKIWTICPDIKWLGLLISDLIQNRDMSKFQIPTVCNGLADLLGRTTSVPKSALRYELDKVSLSDLETCSTPVLFSQN